MRDGDPDLRRKLGADVVHAQRGEQAEYGVRYAGAHGGSGVILGEFDVGAAVETARDPLDGSVVHQPSQRPRVNADRGCVALAEERLCAEVPEAGDARPRMLI